MSAPKPPVRPGGRDALVMMLLLALATGLLGAPGAIGFLVIVVVFSLVQWRRWHRWARYEMARESHALMSTGLLDLRGPIAAVGAERAGSVFGTWYRVDRNGTVAVQVSGDGRINPGAAIHVPQPDFLAVDPVLRDPLWTDTVAQIRADRVELVGRKAMCTERLRAWKASNWTSGAYVDLNALKERDAAAGELSTVGLEINAAKVMGVYRCPPDAGSRALSDAEWSQVPRNTIVRLPRGTHAACDCRYGHYAYHQIVEVDGGSPVRQCDVCSPPTRWIEVGDVDGQ